YRYLDSVDIVYGSKLHVLYLLPSKGFVFSQHDRQRVKPPQSALEVQESSQPPQNINGK
ncbi:hypothetical protein HAX54_021436, partial [Datura stramonium]|nr:hypothetical protein [Datura stramonium]